MVDAFQTGRILKDFGTVEEHRHWLIVGCRRLAGCADTCDRLVQQWVCTRKADCETASGGSYVRSYYIASECKNGYGHAVRKCGSCGFGGLPGRVNNAPGLGKLQDIKGRLRVDMQ